MISARADLTDSHRSKLATFIKARLPLGPAPSVPEVLIHAANPASGLGRLAELSGEDNDAPPYWAYAWAGGAALARHFFARPETVAGRSVLDFGAGCGLVGIAAAKCGARKVIATEVDHNALVALALNATANGVAIETLAQDISMNEAPTVDLITGGDVFYEQALAERASRFFDRCRVAGVEVIIGDVGRAYLPRDRLRLIAEYPLRDFGDGATVAKKMGGVFSFETEGGSFAAPL
jgi:predicted nicotinamide N-methyase